MTVCSNCIFNHNLNGTHNGNLKIQIWNDYDRTIELESSGHARGNRIPHRRLPYEPFGQHHCVDEWLLAQNKDRC